MRIFSSRPVLRWIAPFAVLAAVGGTALATATATADNKLPTISAEQLLVDVQNAKVDGLSGTVVERADLGIPALPGTGGMDSPSLTSLISGTHTLDVRYAGPDKFRLGVHGTYGETDTFVNGKDVWVWSSRDKSATHRTLSGDRPAGERPEGTPQTPEQAAQKVLSSLTPTTTVTTDSAVSVADRDAYELVLQPNDDASLIKQVRIAVDGDTKLPLRVQVFAADKKLVFEVGYTKVDFNRPADREFEFNPPPGTTTSEAPKVEGPSKQDREQAEKQGEEAKSNVKIVGEGWTTVAVTTLPADSANQPGELSAFLDQLTPVSGSWGKGRLLAGTAFSVVLTDDNRLAVGAVKPELLYRALG